MKNVETLTPFKRFCMTIGNIPATYIESMSYLDLLYWLCDFLQKQVIPTINNNSTCVSELQNLFTELKNYVDNYFDNLDVQDEINNKLDVMAENGSLANSIINYLSITSPIIINTADTIVNNSFIKKRFFCKNSWFS